MGRVARPVQGVFGANITLSVPVEQHCIAPRLLCSTAVRHVSVLITCSCSQGVTSPLAGQMLFRSIMFGSFAQIKTWLATNKDGSTRELRYSDFYKVNIKSQAKPCLAVLPLYLSEHLMLVSGGEQAGAATGLIAAFVEGPIDFYKSQIQVQIIRSRADANYKRKTAHCKASTLAVPASSCHTAPINKVRVIYNLYLGYPVTTFACHGWHRLRFIQLLSQSPSRHSVQQDPTYSQSYDLDCSLIQTDGNCMLGKGWDTCISIRHWNGAVILAGT